MASERNDPRVESLLGEGLAVDTEAALGRFHARVPASRAALPGYVRGLAGAFAAIVVAGALTIGGVAESFLQIFEPQRFVAVTVNPRDLSGLPDLSAYGTITWGSSPQPSAVPDVAAAASAAGFTPARPATLPAGVSGAPAVTVLKQTTGTFTFSAAKAAAAAAQVGRTPPPMPAGLDGAALRGTAGPAIIQTWTGTNASMPGLIVAQGRVPSLASDGTSVTTLRDYLLAQPGMPATLAAQLRAVSDPATTLPVPVPAGGRTKNVRVNGAEGLFVGDSTGLGAGVVWRQGEFVYAIVGPLTEEQVLSLASSLRLR